jgi:glycosyltransferase 2 family protein
MTGAPTRPVRWWKRPIVRIAGSLVLLAMLFTILPFHEIRAAISGVAWWVWPVALVTYMCLHLIGVVKWRLLTNVAGAGLTMGGAARAYYWGLFGNTFLPSIVGGDAVRMAMALKSARSGHGLVLGSLVDRLLDIVGLLLVAGIGAWLSPLALTADSRRIFLVAVGLLTAGGVAGGLLLVLFPVHRLRFRHRRKLVPIRRAFRATAVRPGALGAALALGAILQSLLVVLNWQLGRAIGIEIPLYVWLFVWPLAKISGLLPLTQGGIGVREAAQAALFAPFGVSAAKAVATGLVFEVVILAGGLVGGALAFLAGARREPTTGARSGDGAGAHHRPVLTQAGA